MQKKRLIMLVAVLAITITVPASAFAADATPVITDVAKDGRVDGTYTKAQLNAALKSPLLKQYGGTGAVEAVTTKKAAPAKSTSGQKQVSSVAPPATGTASKLPFTGLEALLFGGIGLGLAGAGGVLRRLGRDPEAR